jgi:hypothetical protein
MKQAVNSTAKNQRRQPEVQLAGNARIGNVRSTICFRPGLNDVKIMANEALSYL